MTNLKGMAWNHVRGYAPLEAVTELFVRSRPGAKITWDRRSLKDFGDFPLDRLAREYDLLLIDHPHVGLAAAQGILIPLDEHIPDGYLRDQEAHSVGPSHRSYRWSGRQWALAVDAAAQVASYRPDLLAEREVPRTWEQLLALAESLPEGRRIGWPLCPTDAMCSLLSLGAAFGGADFFHEAEGMAPEAGEQALGRLLELLPLLHESSLASNPIHMYDRMASTDEIVYVPYGFGYSNYARDGFAARPIHFADIPTASGEPRGSLLGGVGIAVSAFSAHVPLAVEFAMLTASEHVQRTAYAESGGQPGHLAAWRDERVNRYCNGFFADTIRTLELSYMRPRNAAFPPFQEQAGVVLHQALRRRREGAQVAAADIVEQMNKLYRDIRQSSGNTEN